MENNVEQIPSEIFDWLEKMKFTGLDASQQAIVLEHFSREEYEAMHQTTTSIKKVGQEEYTGARTRSKEQLLMQFDARHKKVKAGFSLLVEPLFLWKAAAAFMLFGLGWQYYLMQQKKHAAGFMMAIDTVYVTRAIAADPVKIYDTVYLERESPDAYRNNSSRRHKQDSAAHPQESVSPGEETESLPVDERKATRRGNSIKDDSLIRRFSFVTL